MGDRLTQVQHRLQIGQLEYTGDIAARIEQMQANPRRRRLFVGQQEQADPE